MNRVNVEEVFASVTRKLLQEFNETEKVLPLPLDRGAQREEAVREFLREKLPRRYGVSKGFIVSSDGVQSEQCDVIIYDAHTSPVFYSNVDQEVFPVETVYAVIQVKSRLTPTELDNAIKNIASFKLMPREDVTSVPVGPVGGIPLHYDESLNPKLGALISYSLGADYENATGAPARIISKICERPIPERIDITCVIDRALILPLRGDNGKNIFAWRDARAQMQVAGSPDTAVGLFFVTVLSALNAIYLGHPDLFRYFR